MRIGLKKDLALLAAVVGPLFSSLAWVTEQEAVVRLSPLTVAAVSPLLAGVLMLVYLLVRKTLPPLTIFVSHWRELLIFALFRNVIGFLLFTQALLLTSSAKIMFLTKMEPYLVALLFWTVRREPVHRKQLALLLAHIFGAVLLSTGGKTFRVYSEFIAYIPSVVETPTRNCSKNGGEGLK